MFRKHRVFRETDDVVFYDITVEESNASDLVVHEGAATSPPDDFIGAKQFYIHSFQDDYNRVVSGERTFELVNYSWKCPYHIVNLNRSSGALVMKAYTPHPEEPKDGEEVMGVTFKSCDLEDYDKLQSRIDDLKKKLENE